MGQCVSVQCRSAACMVAGHSLVLGLVALKELKSFGLSGVFGVRAV